MKTYRLWTNNPFTSASALQHSSRDCPSDSDFVCFRIYIPGHLPKTFFFAETGSNACGYAPFDVHAKMRCCCCCCGWLRAVWREPLIMEGTAPPPKRESAALYPPQPKSIVSCFRFNSAPAELFFVRFLTPAGRIQPVESKTRTYHGRFGSGRPAGRPGGVGQDWVPTELFAQETQVPCTLQGIEETPLERFSRSTDERNPM